MIWEKNYRNTQGFPGGQLGLSLLTGIWGEQRGEEGVEPNIGVRSNTIRMISLQGIFNQRSEFLVDLQCENEDTMR